MGEKRKKRMLILILGISILLQFSLIAISNEETTTLNYAVNCSTIQPDQRECYALCIGVADYPGVINDLQFCDKDATDVRDWLQSKYHILSANIHILTNSNATKVNIINKIQEISDLMDSNDYFFFFYSGHGDAPIVIDNTKSWNVESPHPYSNNYDKYWSYRIIGAELMRVHFTSIITEENYDGVFVGDNRERDYFYDLFTGSYSNVWSNWVPTSNIYVELYTDQDTTDWGFKVDQVQSAHMEAREIVPWDAIDSNGITGAELDAAFDEVPGTLITVLDSCFSGTIGNEIAGDNRYILTGGTDDEYTLEDENVDNGVFTSKFMLGFESAHDSNGDSVISFDEAFYRIRSTTSSRSSTIGYSHTPTEHDGVEGELILEPNAEILSFSYESGVVDISIAHNGLGYGTFILAFYDMNNEVYVAQNAELILPTSTIQDYQIEVWTGFDLSAIRVLLETQYNGLGEASWRSLYTGTSEFSGSLDSDGDGLDDLMEFANGLNPWSHDSDGDSLWDNWEITNDLNPSISDSDGDGLDDGDEINVHGTDPELFDSDLDKMGDGWEVQYLLNPMDPTDAVEDDDGDLLLNYLEYQHQTNPLMTDTDSDRLSDYEEIMTFRTDPTDRDTDNDLMNDRLEILLHTDPLSNLSSPWLYIVIFGIILIGIGSIALAKNTGKKIRDQQDLGSRPSPGEIKTQSFEYGSFSRPSYSSPPPRYTPPPREPSPTREPTKEEMEYLVKMLLQGKCPACGGSIGKYTFKCLLCSRDYTAFYMKFFRKDK